MSDDKLYDYQVLEECVDMMKAKADSIKNEADGLQSDVNRIMPGWKGSTAEAYQSLSTDLRTDVDHQSQFLNQFRTTVQSIIERMQQQDARGGSQMQGS